MSGDLNPIYYPFSAIYGMESAKRALMCAIANDHIKSILIRGPSGTGKTLIARSIGHITGKSIVNVPLNVTDEQLFGCLDIEEAIKHGRISIQDGLLMRADKNILFMDDINLFEHRTITGVIDSVINGNVRVERENISTSYDLDTILIATMNNSDAYLSNSILDHFDICVNVEPSDDKIGREAILLQGLEFDEDPEEFVLRYKEQDQEIHDKLLKASEMLKGSHPTPELRRVVADICKRLNIDGHRGDITTAYVAMTLSALDGLEEVDDAHITEASVLSLNHRIKTAKGRRVDQMKKVVHSTVGFNTESKAIKKLPHKTVELDDTSEDVNPTADNVIPMESAEPNNPKAKEVEEIITKIGETFETVDLFRDTEASRRGTGAGKGKRFNQRTNDKSGRYVGARINDGKITDLAFDATVRASAPYQVKRHQESDSDLAVIIEKSDMREKIRESKTSSTFLFAVDTSGSLIIRNRMMAVKGAILSLLKDHYIKRDRVGFMTFNEKSITMLLQPSREIEVIHKLLDDLAVGRRTPLSAALRYIDEYMSMYVKKRPNEDCYVILVTDGEANVPLDPSDKTTDPIEEALGLAKRINLPNVQWIVIDSEMKYDSKHHAKDFADALHARYYTLEDLREVTYEEANLVRMANAKIIT